MKPKRNLDREFSRTDPCVKLVIDKIEKENYRPDALIEILHVAQNAYGYLPMEVLSFIAKELRLPPSRVYATVTFYHLFSLKPRGDHTCLVCTGTACYVKGAQAILEELENKFHLKPGEVTCDKKLGLRTARCIEGCGLAPVVVVDEEVLSNVKPEEINDKVLAKMGVKV